MIIRPGRGSLALLAGWLALGGAACVGCDSNRSTSDAGSLDAGAAEAGAAEPGAADAGADGVTADSGADVSDGAPDAGDALVSDLASGELPAGDAGPSACAPRPTIRPGYAAFACSAVARWKSMTRLPTRRRRRSSTRW